MPSMNRIPLFLVSATLITACDPNDLHPDNQDSSSESSDPSQDDMSSEASDKTTANSNSSSKSTENDSASNSSKDTDSTGTESSDSSGEEHTNTDESSSTGTETTGEDESTGSTGDDTDAENTTSETTGESTGDSEESSETGTDTSGDSEEDTGDDTGPSEGSGVFVAQGHMARTTISCDGGQTWVANQSMDNAAVCFENNFDCDHHIGSATGLGFGNGWFVASYGWGTPGEIRRSRDGINWETVMEDGRSVAKIAYGNDVFMGGNYLPMRSDSEANNWTELADSMINDYTVRGVGFAPISGGRFFLGAKANLIYSSDKGDSWVFPASRPEDCGASMKGLAYGNGTLVVTSPPVVCYSTDGGDNWHAKDLEANSAPIWTGTKFMAWSHKKGFSSPTGVDWTAHDLSPSNINLGPVAMDDQGNFVSSSGGWKVWYEKQDFYRSRDGIEWEALDKSKFAPSHPILNIVFARIDGPSPCL